MRLKEKTLTGLLWSSIDIGSGQILHFVVGLILARLLTPEEFGLVGLIAVFIAVSQTVIDGGFSDALVRKANVTNTDYSTVFYFNLILSAFLIVVLIIAAPWISSFFNNSALTSLLRAQSIILIIGAFSIVQRAKLTRDVNFKMMTKVNLWSSGLSGIIGIAMAVFGYGVWSLVVRTIINNLLQAILYYSWNDWRPESLFSEKSFKEMFSFGSKLLLSRLLVTLYNNIYSVVIGKFFSPAQLGIYARAAQFRDLPVLNIMFIINRVNYPVFSKIQDDKVQLKRYFSKTLKVSSFIMLSLMAITIAIAEPMILFLIGEKWIESAKFLQILCIAGAFYPLSSMNLNLLNVFGKSNLYLRIEIIKKLLVIPTIVIGIHYGMIILVISMVFLSLIGLFINSYYSEKLLNYSTIKQLSDIFPAMVIALTIGLSMWIIGNILTYSIFTNLLLQVSAGILLLLLICESLKFEPYLIIKRTLMSKNSPVA